MAEETDDNQTNGSEIDNDALIADAPARSEVTAWLDMKKVGPKKRKTAAENIEGLISDIMEGNIAIDAESGEITHKLKFPTKAFKELKYAARIPVSKLKGPLKDSKGEIDARIIGTICALTGQAKSLIEDLDTEDYTIAYNIALFFL